MSPTTIRCTCSHCQRDTYFDQKDMSPAEVVAQSSRQCPYCGKRGMVIAFNVDSPPGVEPSKPSPRTLA
jgi:NAD-dependent SIR2 family protein deacetylase